MQPDGGWGYSNAGLVTDGGEALLVDTMFDDAHTRAMLDGFAKASSAKIGTLVNTHHNGDHLLRQWLCRRNARSSPRWARRGNEARDARGLAQFMKAAPGLGLTGEYLVHCFGDFDFEHCSVRAPDTTFTGHATRMVGAKGRRADRGRGRRIRAATRWSSCRPTRPSSPATSCSSTASHPVAGPVGNWIAAVKPSRRWTSRPSCRATGR
ncbi:MAG: MBL fold metallo-hydrolase [Rhizomicrobium sp.]